MQSSWITGREGFEPLEVHYKKIRVLGIWLIMSGKRDTVDRFAVETLRLRKNTSEDRIDQSWDSQSLASKQQENFIKIWTCQDVNFDFRTLNSEKRTMVTKENEDPNRTMKWLGISRRRMPKRVTMRKLKLWLLSLSCSSLNLFSWWSLSSSSVWLCLLAIFFQEFVISHPAYTLAHAPYDAPSDSTLICTEAPTENMSLSSELLLRS